MANWKYTIKSGTALREAIDAEDITQVVKCLLFCYEELYKKLTKEDREYCWSDIEDALVELAGFDPDDNEEENEEMIDCWLVEFYDICDEVRAFVAL